MDLESALQILSDIDERKVSRVPKSAEVVGLQYAKRLHHPEVGPVRGVALNPAQPVPQVVDVVVCAIVLENNLAQGGGSALYSVVRSSLLRCLIKSCSSASISEFIVT